MPSVLRQSRTVYLLVGVTCVMLVMLLLACDSKPIAPSSSTPVTTGPNSPVPGAILSRVVPLAVASGIPVLPTPQPTAPPTFPPTQTPDLRPTQPPPPTPTAFIPKPLTDPIPDSHQSGVQWFSQTGHTLRGVFLDYWNQHGGVQQFGYPLTEEFVDASGPGNMPLVVQYFERNRFELDSESKTATLINDVKLELFGREYLQQKGYFTGTYPLYGHASDFSWVSGKMTNYEEYSCFHRGCGCSILRYQGQNNDPRVQFGGETWLTYEGPGFGRFLQNKYFLAFGHLARPGENYLHCSTDGEASLYVVQSVAEISAP